MEREPGRAAAALLRQKRAALRRRGCSFESSRYRGRGGVRPGGAGVRIRPRGGGSLTVPHVVRPLRKRGRRGGGGWGPSSGHPKSRPGGRPGTRGPGVSSRGERALPGSSQGSRTRSRGKPLKSPLRPTLARAPGAAHLLPRVPPIAAHPLRVAPLGRSRRTFPSARVADASRGPCPPS